MSKPRSRPDPAAWRAKTTAELHTPSSFHAYKHAQQLVLLGVMGYVGSWARSGLRGPALERLVSDARQALRVSLEAARARHGAALVMVSGATSVGVLALAYQLCAELGITAMGVTSARALEYPLGEMKFLVSVGEAFGDESEHFVALCDAFVVLGGGAQSMREAELALARGKPVRAITGFGGAADSLATREQLPGLELVRGRE